MKKSAAAAEFSGILRLLREHAFLQYSSTGRVEYDQRLASASELFTNLVSKAAGLPLQAPPGYVQLDKIPDGSFTSLVRTVRRVVARLRRKPDDCSAEESRRLEKLCLDWEKAALLLSTLQG